jgi:hypothetical protein
MICSWPDDLGQSRVDSDGQLMRWRLMRITADPLRNQGTEHRSVAPAS